MRCLVIKCRRRAEGVRRGGSGSNMPSRRSIFPSIILHNILKHRLHVSILLCNIIDGNIEQLITHIQASTLAASSRTTLLNIAHRRLNISYCTINIKRFLIDTIYCANLQYNLQTVNIIVHCNILHNILKEILTVYWAF